LTGHKADPSRLLMCSVRRCGEDDDLLSIHAKKVLIEVVMRLVAVKKAKWCYVAPPTDTHNRGRFTLFAHSQSSANSTEHPIVITMTSTDASLCCEHV